MNQNPMSAKPTLHQLLTKLKALPRFALQWEWMTEHPRGEYVKFAEVEALLLTALKHRPPANDSQVEATCAKTATS